MVGGDRRLARGEDPVVILDDLVGRGARADRGDPSPGHDHMPGSVLGAGRVDGGDRAAVDDHDVGAGRGTGDGGRRHAQLPR